MRCPACDEDNEEGRPFCAACAEELVPGAAAQVEPPRARGPVVRCLGRAGRLWVRLAAGAGRAPLVLTALVPGLAHRIVGRRRTARWLLGGFAAFALLWLVFLGSRTGDIMGMGAFVLIFASVFAASRLDRVTGREGPAGSRHVVLALLLTLGLYAGGSALFRVLWEPARVGTPVARLGEGLKEQIVVFESGDRILFRRSPYWRAGPARGDIVLTSGYRLPRLERQLVAPGGVGLATMHHLPQVQRILALPGDELALRGGRLYLNGQPLAERAYPLHASIAVASDGEWSGVLGEDEYALWGVAPGRRMVAGMEVVPRRAIRGKAWLVYGPREHRRLIDHASPAGRPLMR